MFNDSLRRRQWSVPGNHDDYSSRIIVVLAFIQSYCEVSPAAAILTKHRKSHFVMLWASQCLRTCLNPYCLHFQ